jgi:NAD(P)H-dependent flavin oxidoreductase YrpB (nitropropane dioxygenase family)
MRSEEPIEGRAEKLLATGFCQLVGIELPIVQAPIGSASCPALAAAVSNAGGLGMLALSWRDPEATGEAVRATRELTDRPFGINLALEWAQHERLRICLDEGVRVVSFFWGDPSPYIGAVHDAGALVLHTVGGAAEARRAVEAGVDVVVAQGFEAGGHVWGKVATLPLVPRVVDAVAPVSVLAAGGIGDGRGLAAALALGAQGVWMGTRFLVSEEAYVHPIYKQRVLEAAETDTLYSSLFDGGWPDAPHRTLRSDIIALWEEAGCPPSGRRPREGEKLAAFADGRPIESYSDDFPQPGMTGDLEALALYAGQSVGLVTHQQPAGQIVRQIADEAAAALLRLQT